MNPHELVNDVKEIKRILTELEKRKVPATAEQLEAINQRPIVINPEKFAAYVSSALVNALKEELPNTEHIKVAVNTAVTAIEESGRQTAGHINGAGVTAAQRIEKAARQQADVLASRIGFTSWRSATIVFIGFISVIVVAIMAGQLWAAEVVEAKAKTKAVQEFTNWVKEQPAGKELYKRYYNQ